MSVPAFADIEAAAKRLAGQAVVTPLIESPALNERLGLRVLIKPETLQRVGAFKFRGAYNRLSQIAPADRPRGVVAFSSGNHAQGVALAARLLDMPAVIVMPADAPAVKVSATRGYGAEVVFYDRMTESREAIAARLAEERGAVIVPAYDDPDIIAGQGTAGLELARQVQALGAELDLVVGPVGGGGLMAGVALAVQTLSPKTRIVGVEPELYDDARRSLVSGRRETAAPTVRTLCDSLETPSTGELTFPILRERLSAIVTVNDAEVAEAMRLAVSTLKLVVEPGGAVGLAALMAAKVPEAAPGACVGLVLSGGNVDPDLFARVLRREI
ncbi:MAG: threonine/serine dehydratase [Phenylobacterium sp.]|uniref:threonine ammonia-lyase n=1 Tax=Phenylobacterium sp. TaxID=1871053 RepID=UPI0025CD30E1|nr:threonine/serine dehydratase [Phenylobacterium sp.]MCA6226006.1 threonine/serine dehydratase [Phenylobacterium sp.]MCA6230990.1 threonine/serine dehydratase [Phenylobacterium sp.]MCA6233843.1 threonine/serine dehydratase [Phenylobacterium sp.]MCA6248150.1 threonine/serine dehydratase [Phenylobacterium sp.]MCA6251576.1 threonine/serine dehydratase [Phenylobacterium sp.]